MSSERIALHFNVEKPVEVVELTKALAAIARSYEKVVRSTTDVELQESDYDLYITKIEKNCIFCEVAAYTANALPLVGVINYHNTFATFVKYLGKYISWFSSDEKPDDCSPNKTETQDFVNMLSLASSPDGKGELSVEQVKYNDEGKRSSVTKVSYTPTTVSNALDGAVSHLDKLNAEEREIREKVVLELEVLDRKRSKNDNKSFDRGVIAEISSRIVRVTWESEMDGMRVKDPDSRLKDMEYIVNVQVVRNSKGDPRLYRVIELLDTVS